MQLKRREFITMLGGAACAWPVVARAQRAGKQRTIGFLGPGAATTQGQWTATFVEQLHELGWIEGRTITLEVRWAEGRSERFAEIAAEFVRLKVDVIVTTGGAVPAAKQATSIIPIVFAVANDPLSSGFVTSLARPGGNVTGLSLQSADLAGKRLELLRELVPWLGRLAIIGNSGNLSVVLEIRELEAAARTFGLEVDPLEIRRAEDIAPAFEQLKGHAHALYVCADPLVTSNRARIITLAQGAGLPTLFPFRDYVEAGGLMSYGANLLEQWRRAAHYVDKILLGTKPGDIPVEQPTKFDLAINLTTAKALGLTVTDKLLALADEVVE
jgi:putative ABC transport system substrate-binding protein